MNYLLTMIGKIPLKFGLALLQIHFPIIHGCIQHKEACRAALIMIVSHTRSHGIFMTNLFDAAVVTIDTLPTSCPTSVPSYPYISAPSSDLYPTSTVTWPYCQGINPASSPAYAPSYNPWQTQSPFDLTGGLATTPQRTDRSNTNQPYAQRIETANTGNPPVAAGTLGGLGFGLGLHMSDMQDYPSPSSSTSGQTASSYIPVLPPSVLSPALPLMPSPSVAESTGSRQSSRRSQEPPRNLEGLLYCDHAEHAQQQPPVFSRKCEWR